MITLMVQIQTKPSEHERFLAAAKKLRDATLQEEGNVEYTLWSSLQPTTGALVVERWRDEDALKAHHEAPHMAEFRNSVKGAVAIAPVSDRWETDTTAAE